jgi:hypothetical protein
VGFSHSALALEKWTLRATLRFIAAGISCGLIWGIMVISFRGGRAGC